MKTGCFTKKILKNADTSNILYTERVDNVNCLSLYYNQQEIFFIPKLSFDAVGSIFLYQHVKINLWLLTINSQSDNENKHFFQLKYLKNYYWISSLMNFFCCHLLPNDFFLQNQLFLFPEKRSVADQHIRCCEFNQFIIGFALVFLWSFNSFELVLSSQRNRESEQRS